MWCRCRVISSISVGWLGLLPIAIISSKWSCACFQQRVGCRSDLRNFIFDLLFDARHAQAFTADDPATATETGPFHDDEKCIADLWIIRLSREMDTVQAHITWKPNGADDHFIAQY